MYVDPTGHGIVLTALSVAFVFSLAIGGITVLSNAIEGKKGSELFRGVLGNSLETFASTFLTILFPGHTILFSIIGGFFQVGGNYLESKIRGEEYTFKQMFRDFLKSVGHSLVFDFIGKKLFNLDSYILPNNFSDIINSKSSKYFILQNLLFSLAFTYNKIKYKRLIDRIKEKIKNIDWNIDWEDIKRKTGPVTIYI